MKSLYQMYEIAFPRYYLFQRRGFFKSWSRAVFWIKVVLLNWSGLLKKLKWNGLNIAVSF